MAASPRIGGVAVIGMACRTAGANSPSELWDILANSRDVQSVITRFNTEGFYHPEGGPRKGSTCVRHAYMMDDEAIDKFDHAFFQITPREAMAIDPQQRMLLEVAYECVENAGVPLEDFIGTDTSVMAGVESCDYHDVISRDIDATPKYLATGTPMCMAANRISYFFNLSGTSIAMDTACSSTMVALHQAVRALQHGDSGMALVCGAKLIITPNMFVPSTELGFLSPSGRSRSFDAEADGYGRGEGVIALLLKPMKNAIEDGDPIRAVIKGTRLNQDGRTQGITLPSASAQKENMERLYTEIGLSPRDIHYLEAHGTGTAGGDRLELSAINAVFGHSCRDRSLVVGALKSCIGHLEACAGLASVIKTIECLERGKIPPQMHLKKPNQEITSHGLQVPLTMLDWPAPPSQTRRAAINTFGAGGTNAHAVLENYNHASSKPLTRRNTFLFMVSAADDGALSRLSLKYADYIEQYKPTLSDMAHTLLAHRSQLAKSVFFASSTPEEAISRLRTQTPSGHLTKIRSIKGAVFLFTGQGAQWPMMGKALLQESRLFKEVIMRCDEILSSLTDGPAWSIVDEMMKTEESSNVYQSLYSQTLCTALQLGIIILLESWGISPVAVVGHSSGEIAAAYTAGLLSFEDAIIVAYYRGMFLNRPMLDTGSKRDGSMCALGMCESDAVCLLEQYGDRVQLAAVNSPGSCTLSGDTDAINEIEMECVKRSVFCRRLRVDMAYHSHHVVPMASAYEKALYTVMGSNEPLYQKCQMFSSVTGEKIILNRLSPHYWKDNMISTVHFDSSLTNCIADLPHDIVMVEIGPHPALKGPTREILQSRDRPHINYFNSLFRHKNDMKVLLENVGELIAAGVPVAKRNINGIEIVDGLQCNYNRPAVLKDLPSYQWDHSIPLWYESRTSHNQRFRRFPRHDILGSRYLEDSPMNPSWRSLLNPDDVPWLAILKSRGAMNIPTAALLLMAAEAARQIFVAAERIQGSIVISDMSFDCNLPFSLFGTPPNVELHLITRSAEGETAYSFEISYLLSGHGLRSRRLCSGMFKWDETLIMSKDQGTQQVPRDHDSWLPEQSQAIGEHISARIVDLALNSTGATGRFDNVINPSDHYFLDPEILYSILRLASVPAFEWSLPSVQRIVSVGSLRLPMAPQLEHASGIFTIDVQPVHSNSIQADVGISFGETHAILLSDIRLLHDRGIDQTPAPRSLFFKPVVLPDITTTEPTTEPKHIFEFLKLVTHKWPMCDIAISGIAGENIDIIIGCLQRSECGGRIVFRSIVIVGNPEDRLRWSRVRVVSELPSDRQYHLVVQGSEHVDAEKARRLVLPNGLLCIGLAEKQKSGLTKFFTKVCDIDGINDEYVWSTWRGHNHKCADRRSASHPRLTVFSSQQQPAGFGEAFPGAKHVLLDPVAMKSFIEEEKTLQRKSDAIILDSIEKPIITTWSGCDLVPWFQILLASYTNIIWVTFGSQDCGPHHGVAGNLLRSLQAEQPSIRTAWLVFKDATPTKLHDVIGSAYQNLKSGCAENEVCLEVSDSGSKIVRYLPDDELSVSTGVALPGDAVGGNVLGKNYEISLTTEAATVLVYNEHRQRSLETGEVRVNIEASMIDVSDVWAIQRKCGIRPQPLSCRFFAGKVVSSEAADFAIGGQVVGWYQGPHCGQVDVLSACLHECDATVAPSVSAAEFARMCVALSTVDGAARARKGDIFDIRLKGPLGEQLTTVCRELGAKTPDEDIADSPTFIIDLILDRGLLLNDAPVHIEKYLTSCRGIDMVRQHWKHEAHALPAKQVTLKEVKESFQQLRLQDIYSTVLSHSDKHLVRGVTVKTKYQSLFTNDGTYVLIGGLGGLGRFICSWMVKNGATKLAVISRHGLESQEAKDTHAAINQSHASLEVIRADASDRTAMQNALAQIRQTSQIKGVLNLAMVLEDSQFASMTGEQWDRAVGLKRDSSWILHEETMNDELDFFILLSSIASVLGNRGQGNYNIGNTFLNALARYRRSLGLTAIAVALGAMTEIGVLHDLGKEYLISTLTRSGLSPLGKRELAKIMEAAVLESRHSDRFLILTGLEMFDRVDGKLVGSRDQVQLFWTELPEFGFLQNHKLGDTEVKPNDEKLTLRERVLSLPDKEAQNLLQAAFIGFLSQLLGFDAGKLDASSSLAAYGLDSLSAVSCQYWIHRNLSVNISLSTIFESSSISHLVEETWKETMDHKSDDENTGQRAAYV